MYPDVAGISAQTPPQRPQPFRYTMLRPHRFSERGIANPSQYHSSASRPGVLPPAVQLVHVLAGEAAYYFKGQQCRVSRSQQRLVCWQNSFPPLTYALEDLQLATLRLDNRAEQAGVRPERLHEGERPSAHGEPTAA